MWNVNEDEEGLKEGCELGEDSIWQGGQSVVVEFNFEKEKVTMK